MKRLLSIMLAVAFALSLSFAQDAMKPADTKQEPAKMDNMKMDKKMSKKKTSKKMTKKTTKKTTKKMAKKPAKKKAMKKDDMMKKDDTK